MLGKPLGFITKTASQIQVGIFILFSWWQVAEAQAGFLSSQNCLHPLLSLDFVFPKTVYR